MTQGGLQMLSVLEFSWIFQVIPDSKHDRNRYMIWGFSPVPAPFSPSSVISSLVHRHSLLDSSYACLISVWKWFLSRGGPATFILQEPGSVPVSTGLSGYFSERLWLSSLGVIPHVSPLHTPFRLVALIYVSCGHYHR